MSKIIGHTGAKHNLLKYLPSHPFDYSYLMWALRSYRSPRDKVGRMLKEGIVIHIKKGLYVLSPEYGGQIDKKVIANLIYGPSYVSLEFAMQYWGLIPERVEVVTSVTNKRNKFFSTPLGAFSYKHMNKKCFHPGLVLERCVILKPTEAGSIETGFFIATKEKAICDKLALIREIKNEGDVASYLESDLRIDMDSLDGLNMDILGRIEKIYRKKSVTGFVRWYSENLK